MNLAKFRQIIHIAIIKGFFKKDTVIEYLKKNDWHTIEDVPKEQRQKMIDDVKFTNLLLRLN